MPSSEIGSSSDTSKSGKSDQTRSKLFNPDRKKSDLLNQQEVHNDVEKALKDNKTYEEIVSVADKTIEYLNDKLKGKESESARDKSKYTGHLTELRKSKDIPDGVLKKRALKKGLEDIKSTLKTRIDKLSTKITRSYYSTLCESIGTALGDPDNVSVIQQTVQHLEEHSEEHSVLIGELDKQVRDKKYDDALIASSTAFKAFKDDPEATKATTKDNVIKALKDIKPSIDRTMHNLTMQRKINESGRSEDFKKIMSNLRDNDNHKERKKYEITIKNYLKQLQKLNADSKKWEEKNNEKTRRKNNPYKHRIDELVEKIKEGKPNLGFFTSRKLEIQGKIQEKLKAVDERLEKYKHFGEPYKRAKQGLHKFGSRGAKLFKASREYWKESPNFRSGVYAGGAALVVGLLTGGIGAAVAGGGVFLGHQAYTRRRRIASAFRGERN